MRRFLAPLLIALTLAAGLLPQAARADIADINAAARSVVRVVLVQRDADGYDVIGHGTGFAVTERLIVTNAHVLEPLAEQEGLRLGVVPAQGRTGYFARVVRIARGIDLALIELTEPATLPPVTLYSGAIEDGAEVFAVGYPANVDQALGQGLAALTSPQAPVKTRGNVSAGRSLAQFDTILHTAPIGVGNSGGPLLDSCGRVVGVNSFGTISDNSSDSEFYFAVSMRELAPFLRAAGVDARRSGEPCRSLAAFDAEEDARALREAQAQRAATAAAAAERREAGERARRRAEFEALDDRDEMLALAGVLIALAVVGAGGSVLLVQRDRGPQAMAAAAAAAMAIGGAGVAWMQRPSASEIEARADAAERRAIARPAATTTTGPVSARVNDGRFICRLDDERSRVTVSDPRDIALEWETGGCVNGRTQYGLANGEWSRILVPDDEQAVSINRYDPRRRIFITDRYLLDLPVMERARTARSSYQAPICGAGQDAAIELGAWQQAIRAMLPATPNERLTYRCEPASGAEPIGSGLTEGAAPAE